MARLSVLLLALGMLVALSNAAFVPYINGTLFVEEYAGAASTCAVDTRTYIGTKNYFCIDAMRFQVDGASPSIKAYVFASADACTQSIVGSSEYLRVETYDGSCIVGTANGYKLSIAKSVPAEVAGFKVRTATYAAGCPTPNAPSGVTVAYRTTCVSTGTPAAWYSFQAESATLINRYKFATEADCIAGKGWFDTPVAQSATACTVPADPLTTGATGTVLYTVGKVVVNTPVTKGLYVRKYTTAQQNTATDFSCPGTAGTLDGTTPYAFETTKCVLSNKATCTVFGDCTYDWIQVEANGAVETTQRYSGFLKNDCSDSYATVGAWAATPTASLCMDLFEFRRTVAIAPSSTKLLSTAPAADGATCTGNAISYYIDGFCAPGATSGFDLYMAEGTAVKYFNYPTLDLCKDAITSRRARATGTSYTIVTAANSATCIADADIASSNFRWIKGTTTNVVPARTGKLLIADFGAGATSCTTGTPTYAIQNDFPTSAACFQTGTGGNLRYNYLQVDAASPAGGYTKYAFDNQDACYSTQAGFVRAGFVGTATPVAANGCEQTRYRVAAVRTVPAVEGNLYESAYTAAACPATPAPTVGSLVAFKCYLTAANTYTRVQYDNGAVRTYVFPTKALCEAAAGEGTSTVTGNTVATCLNADAANYAAGTYASNSASYKFEAVPFMPAAGPAYISEFDYSSTDGTTCAGDTHRTLAHFSCNKAGSVWNRYQAWTAKGAIGLYKWTFSTQEACETLSARGSDVTEYTAGTCSTDAAITRDTEVTLAVAPASARLTTTSHAGSTTCAAASGTVTVTGPTTEANMECFETGTKGYQFDTISGTELLRVYTFAAASGLCGAAGAYPTAVETVPNAQQSCVISGANSIKFMKASYITLGQPVAYIKVESLTTTASPAPTGQLCAGTADATPILAYGAFYCNADGYRFQAEAVSGVDPIVVYKFFDQTTCELATFGAVTSFTESLRAADALAAPFNSSKCAAGTATPKMTILATAIIPLGTIVKQLNATVYQGNNTCTSDSNITYSVLVNAHCVGATRLQVEDISGVETIMEYTMASAFLCTSSLTDDTIKAVSVIQYAGTCVAGETDGFMYTIATGFPAVPASYQNKLWVQVFSGNTSCLEGAQPIALAETQCVGQLLYSNTPDGTGIYGLDMGAATDACANATAGNVSVAVPKLYTTPAITGYQTGFGGCVNDGTNGYKFALAPASPLAQSASDVTLTITMFNNTDCNATNLTGSVNTNPINLPSLCDQSTGMLIQAEGTWNATDASAYSVYAYTFANAAACAAANVGDLAEVPKQALALNTCIVFGTMSVNITSAEYVWPAPFFPSPPAVPSPPPAVPSPTIPSPPPVFPSPPVVNSAGAMAASVVLFLAALLF